MADAGAAAAHDDMTATVTTFPQTLVVTNTPAPYRLPVFEALGGQLPLTVYFCEGHDPDRMWQIALQSDRVQYEVGTVRRLPRGLVWNSDLAGRLHQTPFDVYIAGDNFTSLLSILHVWWTARRQHKPFIIWCEAIDTAYASGNAISNMYRRWLYARTDAFLAFGRRPQAYLLNRGAAPDRIVQGLQVIPAEQIPSPTSDKAALGLTGKTVVLYVGYFIARKGVDHLIKAFQQVGRPDDILALVGNGPEGPVLRKLSGDDPRILFPGYLDGTEKSNWYAAADLFVLPTLHDPWGLVVNEAMTFGLPIIATEAAGCVPDIVRDNDNGLVVPSSDVPALKVALTRLLDDAGLRQQMGQRSRAIISDYTTEAAADRFRQVIERALIHQRTTDQT